MWPRIINIVLGLWLMIAPALLGYGKAAADNGRICGPIIITFALIALWEATRTVRLWNLPVALWLLASPWVLGHGDTEATVSDMATGVCVLLLALVRGRVEQRFGGGWKALMERQPEHAR